MQAFLEDGIHLRFKFKYVGGGEGGGEGGGKGGGRQDRETERYEERKERQTKKEIFTYCIKKVLLFRCENERRKRRENVWSGIVLILWLISCINGEAIIQLEDTEEIG